MTLDVLAPVAGRAIPLDDVPDEAFSARMLGPGLAIEPSGTVVDAVSPVDGSVLALHPHAYVVVTAGGVGVLVHLGIDTVRLDGSGFTLHVAKGDTLAAGDRVVTWDLDVARSAGLSTTCPVVVLEAAPGSTGEHAAGDLLAGDRLFRAAAG